ncbi:MULTISPECIES: hypothetical protein [unclassified Fibrobacter]|uniref:hypothetical protein n=1 Tax=unclassified Fibrobacter TaxID=2634177 RepID=UPI0009342452|nr:MULTISPECIES: hypothetical protein [unclassified Fibrobacter]MDO4947547.1 hypothetical protein [Fibrobacter sp.]OWV04346.1 hypothetical protein B7993_10990 [Fibrobacter sp. UWH3]OWV05194.1 hypothetical protein B7992_15610 [Fibrobacter sp. UWH1]
MYFVLIAIVVFGVLLLLVSPKQEKRERVKRRDFVQRQKFQKTKIRYNPPHKDFSQTKPFDEKAFWKSQNVKYRNEKEAFIDPKNAEKIDASLADDKHGKMFMFRLIRDSLKLILFFCMRLESMFLKRKIFLEPFLVA